MQIPEIRRVANLTTEQITRKRAVDRSNQKNYRAKNKEYIRHLEAKVAELTYNLERAESRLRCYEDQHYDNTGSERLSLSPVHAQSSAAPYDLSRSCQLNCPGVNVPGELSLASRRECPPLPWPENARSSLPLDFSSGMATTIFDSSESIIFSDLGLQSVNLPENADGLNDFDVYPSSNMPEPGRCSTTTAKRQHPPEQFAPLNKLENITVKETRHWREHFLNSDRHVVELEELRLPSISSLLNQSPSGRCRIQRV